MQSYGLLRKLQKGNAYFEEEFPPIGQKRGLSSLVLALKQRRSASSSQGSSRGRDLLRQEIHPTPSPSPKPLLNPPLNGRTSSSLVLPDLQSGRMEFQHLQCDLMFAGLQIPIPNAGGLQIRPNGSLYTPPLTPPKPLLNPPLKGRTSSSLVLPDLQSGRMEFQHLQCDLMFAGLQIPIPNAGGLQIRPNGSLYTPPHSPSAPSHPPQREKPPPFLPRGGMEPMA